jgi:hypothetical protein
MDSGVAAAIVHSVRAVRQQGQDRTAWDPETLENVILALADANDRMRAQIDEAAVLANAVRETMESFLAAVEGEPSP